MDGAMEFGSQATAELLELLQAKQTTPVPYRPKLLGLVERFHRTWKDIVSLYINEEQTDWDDFLPSALYAYNGTQHATHGYQPNELMMGRKLRTPAELLRRSGLRYPYQTLDAYHEVLMQDLKVAQELAAVALQKEQARQAMYYNRRNVRQRTVFRPRQLVWIYRPARGPEITKFAHRWRGPGQIVEAAGYDNYLIKMLKSGRELVTHCSFLLPYYYPTHLLEQMARDIAVDLRDEAVAAADIDPEEEIDGDRQTGLDGREGAENSSLMAADQRQPAEEPAMVTFADLPATAEAQADAATETTPEAAVEDTPEAAAEPIPAADAETSVRAAADEGAPLTNEAASRRRGRPRKHPLPTADEPAAAGREPKRRRVRTAAAADLGDAVAGRTRARIRRSPYPGTESEVRGGRRDESPSRALAVGTSIETPRAAAAGDDGAAGSSSREGLAASTTTTSLGSDEQPADKSIHADTAAVAEESPQGEHGQLGRRQPAAEQADEEPRVYVFAGRGRRGVDSLVSPQPRLPRIQPTEAVVERRRRRFRTRTGRYALEFEITRVGNRPDGGAPTLWVNKADYEQLWRDGRLRNEVDEADAASPSTPLQPSTADEPRDQ